MDKQVLLKITLPKLDPDNHVFKSFKITPRSQNAHAYVNAAFLVTGGSFRNAETGS
jgi:xanthine dehydrogenase/oxidase